MKKTAVVLAMACILVGVGAGSALSYRAGKDGGTGDFPIYVAPATLAKTAPCDCVTIHTEVPLTDAIVSVTAAVDGTGVTVLGVFADARGQLVARLSFDEVVAIPTGDTAVITLTLGEDVNPDPDVEEIVESTGVQTVAVKG